MKIKKDGRCPWEGKVMKCNFCNCEFELDDSDKEKISSRDVDDGTQHGSGTIYSISCPHCNENIEFS